MATIYVLDDEAQFCDVIEELLKEQGFAAESFTVADRLYTRISEKLPDFFLIDCLLPQKSGIEIALEIRAKNPHARIILMSGVFKDNYFIKEGIKNTGSIGFLKKPFAMEELLTITGDPKTPKEQTAGVPTSADGSSKTRGTDRVHSGKPQTESVAPLLLGFSSLGDRHKWLSNLKSLHGYLLPLLYRVLTEVKFSGVLTIQAPERTPLALSFLRGRILHVDEKDETSYLGQILLEMGFIATEDLDWALANKHITGRLGERLIASSRLSPHGFYLALKKQLTIRLTKTCVNTVFQIQASPSDFDESRSAIEPEDIPPYLFETVVSRIPADWIKNFLASIDQEPLVWENQNFQESLQDPRFSPLRALYVKLVDGLSLQQVRDRSKMDEDLFYKCVYFLFTNGDIRIDLDRQQEGFVHPKLPDPGTNEHSLEGSWQNLLKLIERGEADRALKMVDELPKNEFTYSPFRLVRCWAILATNPNPIALNKVENELLMIPSEDRLDGIFYFVSGLLALKRNDSAKAVQDFQKTVSLNPTFVPVQNELRKLKAA